MKILKTTLLSLVILNLSACGFWVAVDEFEDEGYAVEEENSQQPVTHRESSLWEEETQNGVKFEGYVMSAFAVVVDGKDYDDMEHFYTEELARLPQKIQDAGYDDDYEIELQAQVGISDLWHNMRVYLAPNEPTGFQATTNINANGRFDALLPEEALDKDYKVRALKRISLLLKRDSETIRICYNFSAVEKQVFFDGQRLPIILDNFETRITAYDCPVVKEAGLAVPGKDAKTIEVSKPLDLGQSKSEVASVMGMEGIFFASSERWCWANQAKEAPRCEVDLGGEEPCQCWVDFDNEGIVISHENISAKYLGLE